MPTKKGPFTVLERVVKYENPFGLKVIEDKIIRPDGKEGIFGYVQIRGGSTVLPIDDDKDNTCYLGREFQYGLGEYATEPSSGARLNENEAPLTTAKRELSEELGISGKQWFELGYATPLSGRIQSDQYLFMTRGLSFDEAKQGIYEQIFKVKMSFKDLFDMVMKSEVKDAIAQTIIMKSYFALKKEGVINF